MKPLLRKSTTYIGVSAIAVVLFVTAIFSLNQQAHAANLSGRLITIHDRGDEKVLLSDAATIADALSSAGISLDERDAVEPALDEKLVASEYQINIYRARPVMIIDGVTRQRVITPYQTAAQIVKDTGIVLYPEDQTVLTRSDDLVASGAGLQLKIDRATLFTLNLFGTKSEIRTQGATVGDMLKEKGIQLGASDRTSLALGAAITAGGELAIWREGKQTVSAEVAIPFSTEQIRDADRDVGYKAVQTSGAAGVRSVTYEIEIKGGVEVSRVEIASITKTEPVKQVEVIGAKFKGAYTTPSQNESITWDYLIAQGFSREQTAGIMGNLKQEHGFNTTGDGLAQWTGSRKATLLARDDPYNIYTQLDFLMYELNGGYRSVQTAIKAAYTVEEATIIFQNKFERCGICVEDRRIQYAYNILASH